VDDLQNRIHLKQANLDL